MKLDRGKVRTALVTLTFVSAGCAALPRALARDALDELQARIIDINHQVSPCVVHIESAIRVNGRRNLIEGSGFVVDASGVILTNWHVVDRAEKVSVILAGRDGRYDAEIVGTDKQTDVAVLRIAAHEGEQPFPAVKVGDSDKVQVGEWVIAIGNPYGLEGSVSLGIVSAKGRDLRTEQVLNDFIQTDAMIDHGSSGGPLIDLKGEVIGINSRGQGRGIGFTIPIDTAKRVADDLLDQGRIARGYLGVTLQPLARELAQYWGQPNVHGVVVGSVAHDSPAERAGIKVGDVLLKFDGEQLHAEKEEDLGQFQRLVAQRSAGRDVAIEILRGTENKTVHASLATQPKFVPDEQETPHGFTVEEVTDATFRGQRLPQREGVLVSYVESGSEADEAGMERGDLIVELEKSHIATLEDFRRALKGLPSEKPFLVRALRGDDTRFLLLAPRSVARGEKPTNPTKSSSR
ncbi:MAG: trypsin-like peptidase domain-containing protein [Myxococcota bacterium]